MKQRPIVCLSFVLCFLLFLLPAGLFYKPSQITEKCEAQITGEVTRSTIKNEKLQLELKNCQINTSAESFLEDKLLIYLKEISEYPIGVSISLSGTIYPTEEARNPGQFQSKLYYAAQGISYTVFAENAEIIGGKPYKLLNRLAELQKGIAEVYTRLLSEEQSGILRAMVLGEKQALNSEVKEFYQKNGISHLLAISGLHISMLGMGLYHFLKKTSSSCLAAGACSVLFLIAYAWMTGASISAVRAVLMCSLAILADVIGRTYDMLTAIAVAALVLVYTNPLSVKQSAFLLSFGAVLAIALFQPLWKFYFPKNKGVMDSLGVSLSVLLITFPILLSSFSTYSLYSTFLNLLVIPLMSILMFCAICCGVSGLFCLPLAKLCAIPCCVILKIYGYLGSFCLSLPASVLTIGKPAVWKVILYYALLVFVLLLLYKEKRREKYWLKKIPFQVRKEHLFFGGVMLSFGILLFCFRFHTGLEITMLDVGQGDSIFLRSPKGTTFLIDAGSSNVSGVGKYRILPYLQSEGMKRLDYLLLSHMDSDHISAVEELLEGIEIGHVALPKLNQKDEAYLEMEQKVQEKNIPILYLAAGDCLTEGAFSLKCLWPNPDNNSDDRNELSLVLLTEYKEFQMLFTGDIGKETEQQLANLEILPQVEVLKVAHHGSRYSSVAAFVERTAPLLSLISCSATNRYGHPGEETLERLESVGSKIWITKDRGAIFVKTNGKYVRVSSFLV